MRKSFLSLLFVLAATLTLTAQDTQTYYMVAPDRSSEVTEDKEVTDEDFERMLRAYSEVEFRKQAINFLGLTEQDDISEFTDLFLAYNDYNNAIDERRKQLVMNFRDEMKDEEDQDDINDETADFIENYWELKLERGEENKDLFDKLEDLVGPQKALQFFALADANQARVNRLRLMRSVPRLMMVEPAGVSYQYSIDDFNNWNRRFRGMDQLNIDGQVSLGHEYTKTGLEKLWNAVGQFAAAEGITIKNLNTKKQETMKLANDLTTNWRDLSHANSAKKAFRNTADAIKQVAMNRNFDIDQSMLNKLDTQVSELNVNKKLTNQSQAVYGFFDAAESIVNELVSQAQSGTSTYRQMKGMTR